MSSEHFLSGRTEEEENISLPLDYLCIKFLPIQKERKCVTMATSAVCETDMTKQNFSH